MAEVDTDRHDEEEAPEGEWGWAVAFGLATVLIVTLGPMACFGLIFGNFLEGIGEGSRGVTLINSVYMTLHSFSGLFTNYALKSYSCRQVALFGSFLFFIGNLLSSFANSVLHMIFTFSILPGIGLGLMIPASFHCFNAYFIRRRMFVMGIAQTTLSAGIMLYPIIVEKLVDRFGFRGAQAIVAALTLSATLGSLTFVPVRKTPPRKSIFNSVKKLSLRPRLSSSRELADSQPKVSPRNSLSLLKFPRLTAVEGATRAKNEGEKQNGSKHMWQRECVKLMHTTNDTNEENASGKGGHKLEDSMEVSGKDAEVNADETLDAGQPLMATVDTEVDNEESMRVLTDSPLIENGVPLKTSEGSRYHSAPRPSVISIGSLVLAGADSMALQDRQSASKVPGNWLAAVIDFLDLSLLKDPTYANLALGVSFAYYSDFTFITLFPLFMFSLGYSMADTALCISIGAACDLAGRVVFSLLGAWCSIRSRTIFLAGATCMVLGRGVMIYVNDFLALSIANGFHGFFRSWIHVNFSLVFAEHCSRDRFPSAYGLFMAMSGVIGISTGPLIGAIRDLTNSYPVCIHSLNIQMLLCVVPWVLELTYTWCMAPSRRDKATP